MTTEGATPADESKNLGECMGRWKHSWQWIWEGTVWTDRQGIA